MNAGIGYCNEPDAFLAGRIAAENALQQLGTSIPDWTLAFCSGPISRQQIFFTGVQSVVGFKSPIIGGSAIGVITNDALSYRNYPSAVAVIQSNRMQYDIAAASGLNEDETLAGKNLPHQLTCPPNPKALLLFYDSLKVPSTGDNPPILNASSLLLEGIEKGLEFHIPVFGAGLLDDYNFNHPVSVFCGSHVDTQSVAGVLLSGDFTPYFRIMHGCTPLDGVYHKITKIKGSVIYELDDQPVVEMIDHLYGDRDWRHLHPVDLLTLGVNLGGKFEPPEESNYVNRLITGVVADGKGISIFEPDLHSGTEIQFMLRDGSKMVESANKNSSHLMNQINIEGKQPILGIYIDCAGRTADYSNTSTEEAAAVQAVFNRCQVPLIGFYSAVEIAPFHKKSRGLDWTGVLLVLAE